MVLKSHLDLKLKRPSEWPLYATVTTSQSSRTPLRCGGTGLSEKNLYEMFLALW